LTAEARQRVRAAVGREPGLRLKAVVSAMGWAHSSFFRRPAASKRRPGPSPKPLDPELSEMVQSFALMYPLWGYKKLAVVVRRAGVGVSNRFVAALSSPSDGRERLEIFRERYNGIRPLWALKPVAGGDVVAPAEVYRRGVEIELPAWQGWAKAAKRELQELMDQECEAA
jgi:hypothetical protein